MIRKSATGVIVALAVIWGGGTWYTGTQIQPGVEKFIKDFNDAKKKGEPHAIARQLQLFPAERPEISPRSCSTPRRTLHL